MNRRMGWAVVFGIVWACTSVPPSNDAGSAGGGSAGVGGGSAGGAAGGGSSMGGGSAQDAGCSTACDCAPGYSCFNTECVAGTAPVYCCPTPPCPAGDFCQQPAGTFDTCPQPDGGSTNDGGGVRFDGGRPDGGRLDGGAIDGGCSTACDCPPGQACTGKSCGIGPTAVYCCGDVICPKLALCQQPGGAYQTCGSDGGGGPFDAGRGDGGTKLCTTACDCPPGLLCTLNGRCLSGFAPVYCCGSGTCPDGGQCQTDAGKYDVCGP